LTLLRYLLLPFSLLFRAIVWVRNTLYTQGYLASYVPPIPTLSVGNLSVGGTGKTPVAEFILDYFHQGTLKVAYLSRGYGRATKGYLRVSPEKGGADQFGDEALQVAHKFPQALVSVCEDRKTGLQRLQAAGAQLVVLDDAFQHRKVDRHLDLIVIDANNMPYEDSLLPAGRLREPLSSLKRADLVIINKVATPEKIPDIQAKLSSFGLPLVFACPKLGAIEPFFPGVYSPPSSLKGLEVILFAGLGNNAFFQKQVENQGAVVRNAVFFRDHHAYQEKDLEKISHLLPGNTQISSNFGPVWILTTEKDYTRLRGVSWLDQYKALPMGYLPIQLEWIGGNQALTQKLDALVSR